MTGLLLGAALAVLVVGLGVASGRVPTGMDVPSRAERHRARRPENLR
jgi:hypothetical protein